VQPVSKAVWHRLLQYLSWWTYKSILSVNGRHIYWTSFGKGENKGSVLLWYSCFDHSILICLMHEGLQYCISTLKHCMTKLWNDINQLTFVFPFAETRSIKQMWRQLTERILWAHMSLTPTSFFWLTSTFVIIRDLPLTWFLLWGHFENTGRYACTGSLGQYMVNRPSDKPGTRLKISTSQFYHRMKHNHM